MCAEAGLHSRSESSSSLFFCTDTPVGVTLLYFLFFFFFFSICHESRVGDAFCFSTPQPKSTHGSRISSKGSWRGVTSCNLNVSYFIFGLSLFFFYFGRAKRSIAAAAEFGHGWHWHRRLD